MCVCVFPFPLLCATDGLRSAPVEKRRKRLSLSLPLVALSLPCSAPRLLISSSPRYVSTPQPRTKTSPRVWLVKESSFSFLTPKHHHTAFSKLHSIRFVLIPRLALDPSSLEVQPVCRRSWFASRPHTLRAATRPTSLDLAALLHNHNFHNNNNNYNTQVEKRNSCHDAAW